MTDLTKLAFDSRQNYLKRSTYVGTTALTLPGAGATVSTTITHALGYVPFVSVAAQQVGTTVTWSNNYVHENLRTSSSADDPVQLSYTVSNTDLVITLTNGNISYVESGTRNVYWVIYLDYDA